MKHLFPLFFGAGLLLSGSAAAQDLTNAGAAITVEAGATLFVGAGGFINQAGSSLTNTGTLRVDGALTNQAGGTLNLSTGTVEVRGDFTNAGTLSPGTSPVSFTGTADQLLTSGGASLYQVLLNKTTAGANTLHLAGDLTLTSNLTLTNGLLNTKNGSTISTLRLPHGATLAGEATGRYVLGSLEITRNAVNSGLVDFGHGASLSPGSALGTVAITRTAGLLTDNVSRGVNLASNIYKGIDRIWTVVPTTQPAANAPVQLTLSWLADDDNGMSGFTQARIYGQTANGQPWALHGPETDASGRSITASFGTLNRFTVSNAASPLPVTLLDFTARAEGLAAVRLSWATATELNNAGFTVERSRDARNFAAIGSVAGAGNSTARHDYALLDDRLPAGATLLYYRLRQTDVSGEVSYSPVRSVGLAPLAAGFVVYPTRVASGQAVRYLYTGPAEAGTLEILSVVGQLMGTIALDGRAQGEVPMAGLATGAYFLRYAGPAGRFTTRCVVE
ncbi:hypothetical protein [Hymenobacter sp. IS2118]|uniref:hypothetical protein n=1 Tax=Hymenobacter sp. IS2118 TaxID=1505605 RepID=UPI0006906493|nr:hypothetical protein [Hymenobacter sp. IS2118]